MQKYVIRVHMRGVETTPEPEHFSPEPPRRGQNSQNVFPPTPPDSRSSTPIPGSSASIDLVRRTIPFTASHAPITPGSTPPSSASSGRSTPKLNFSFLLASDSDRVYRHWFEDEEMTSMTSSALGSRKTSQQTLSPAGHSALVDAQINCIRVVPAAKTSCPFPTNKTSSYMSYGSGSYTPTSPRLFEFYYSTLRLDVGKLVASLETTLDRGSCKSVRVVFLGH